MASGGSESAAEAAETPATVAERRFVRSASARASKDHVWSYDFVQARTSDGRAVRMLTLIDEYTRECLAIDVARSLTSEDVLERLADLFVRRGVPDYIRTDNGAEFTATRFGLAGSGRRARRCSSSRASPGRTATSRASTASCGTSFGAGDLRHAAGGEGPDRARDGQYNTIRPHSSLGLSAPGPGGDLTQATRSMLNTGIPRMAGLT